MVLKNILIESSHIRSYRIFERPFFNCLGLFKMRQCLKLVISRFAHRSIHLVILPAARERTTLRQPWFTELWYTRSRVTQINYRARIVQLIRAILCSEAAVADFSMTHFHSVYKNRESFSPWPGRINECNPRPVSFISEGRISIPKY